MTNHVRWGGPDEKRPRGRMPRGWLRCHMGKRLPTVPRRLCRTITSNVRAEATTHPDSQVDCPPGLRSLILIGEDVCLKTGPSMEVPSVHINWGSTADQTMLLGGGPLSLDLEDMRRAGSDTSSTSAVLFPLGRVLPLPLHRPANPSVSWELHHSSSSAACRVVVQSTQPPTCRPTLHLPRSRGRTP